MDNPAASDNTFTHEPLPDSAKYIRLLEVLHDNHSDTVKVRCRLTTWQIDSAPPYHAISYTWGDATSNATILMNEKALVVRTNCEFALKQAYWYRKNHSYLYRKWRPRLYEQSKASWYRKARYFWLDAICIDQANLGEKSKQVAMMGSIYKKASHVLACIGDHADDSLFFFQTLYGLSHYVVRPRDMIRLKRFKGSGVSFRFRLLHRYSTNHRFVLALARLAVRPYFTRMWILQELQHAQHITILCGNYVLPKEDALHLFGGLLVDLERLKQDPNSYEMRNPPHFPLIHHRFLRRHVWHGIPHPVWYGDWIYRLPKQCAATLVMLRQNYGSVKDTVFQLLKEVVCRLQCEDPRDKVYGIISLIDWADIGPLEPDYTQDHIEVAVKFIDTIMKLGEARDIGEPAWSFFIIVIKLLNLNKGSWGWAEALEARRGDPENWAERPAMLPIKGAKVQVNNRGWRLSPEDIDENASKLRGLQVTPPKYPQNDALFLPRWARPDDWVIEVDPQAAHDLWYEEFDAEYQMMPTYIPLLVMREGASDHCNALIGYGFYSSLTRFDPPSFKQDDHADIDIYFDIEDAIVFLGKMKQLYELHLDSKDWMFDFLNTGVCKRQTPGSSYAILPANPPARTKRVLRKPKRDAGAPYPPRLGLLHTCTFVLWDTKDCRGWLVDGRVVALQLLCAYLRNIPQTEVFDFSRLNHMDEKSPNGAYKVLSDWGNRNIIICRVLKDAGEVSEHGGSSKSGQAIIEKRFLGEVIGDICRILFAMNPLQQFPGEVHHFFGMEITIERHRNTIVNGWDFEKIYRTNKAKVYTHVFERIPAWFGYVKDLPASLIFGTNFGEVLQPEGQHCPHFKPLPKGQDYLAVDMHRLQAAVDGWTSTRVAKSEMVARLSHYYAWEHSVSPFSHLHGQDDHLEQVDSSCFPVQRPVKVPHYDVNHPEKDLKLLKKRIGRLYSSQDVENMNVVTDEDTIEAADNYPNQMDKRPLKTGMIVFGYQPDREQLRQLAQADL